MERGSFLEKQDYRQQFREHSGEAQAILDVAHQNLTSQRENNSDETISDSDPISTDPSIGSLLSGSSNLLLIGGAIVLGYFLFSGKLK
jgi:hypothetical protein